MASRSPTRGSTGKPPARGAAAPRASGPRVGDGAPVPDPARARLAIVGVGLIGGSIALAARERLGASVAGFDASEDALRTALERGVLDHAGGSVAEAVAGAEAVFVAVPVGALEGAV